jgi:hypothetical protein
MTRRIFFLLFVLAAIGAVALAADLPSAWRAWRYSHAVERQHVGVLNYVSIDRDAYAHSENHLADLRIIDELGAELPYEMRTRLAAPPQSIPVPAFLRENSFVPGQFTQLVVDLGAHANFHNTLRVQTPESDFINWVEVAASDDAHLWRIVKPRAPISRFRRENLEGNQTIRYSENNARYLRLRIQESSHQFPVTAVNVFSTPPAEKEAVNAAAVTLTPLASPNPPGVVGQTQWSVDLGTTGLPVAEINFETTQPEFYRAVRILTSVDTKEWQPIGGGEIYRYSVGGKAEESLRVRCYEVWGPRYWRVEILNANDAPLSSVQMSLLMTTRFLLFYPRENRNYRLIYGNARANGPQYDLAKTLRIQANEMIPQATLGTEEPTSNYADPRPYTERHPNLLWFAVGIAVVLLGYAALRALRVPSSPGAQ